MRRAFAFERVTGLLRWLWYFVYLQFLFVAGALAGLLVVGVFPSLFASVLVAKELAEPDGGYFATRRFVALYRAVFWKSLQIGYLSTFVVIVSVSNVLYFTQMEATASWAVFVKTAWVVAGALVTGALILVSPTFVNYRLGVRRLPRLVLTGLSDVRSLLLLLFGAATLGAGFIYFTGLFLYIVLGGFVVLFALVNRTFERRKISFARDNAASEAREAVASSLT